MRPKWIASEVSHMRDSSMVRTLPPAKLEVASDGQPLIVPSASSPITVCPAEQPCQCSEESPTPRHRCSYGPK